MKESTQSEAILRKIVARAIDKFTLADSDI
jgi:hypothetical protein